MRLWSTSTTAEVESVPYWKEAICEAIFELEFDSSDASMQARLCQQNLGLLKLSDISISSPHRVVRSPQAAMRDRQQLFNLNYIRRGKWQVEQCGRSVQMGSGDLVLLDNRRPYSVRADAGTEHIVVHLPADWLRCFLPRPEDAVARTFGPLSPWYSMLTATLAEVMAQRPDDSAMRAACAQQIGGAVALGFGEYSRNGASHTDAFFRRITAAIRERFCDLELDAAAVAQQINISPRYLHKLLAQHDTTFQRELFNVRLQQAWSMLRNPQFSGLSVAEIGWRCGFCDPSHFSRRFKLQFSQSPGSCRSGLDAEASALAN